MAIYMIVWLAGLGAGQYLVALADPNTFRLLIVSSVLVSMSLGASPPTWAQTVAPRLSSDTGLGLTSQELAATTAWLDRSDVVQVLLGSAGDVAGDCHGPRL